MIDNWKGDAYLDKMVESVKKDLIVIGFKMSREIKESMGGYGRYSRMDTKTEVKGSLRNRSTGARHYPSPPGSPPAVDTGRLRGSISVNWSGSNLSRGDVEKPATENDGVSEPKAPTKYHVIVVVGTSVNYAPHLEYGTKKMAPRPSIRPVFAKYRHIKLKVRV